MLSSNQGPRRFCNRLTPTEEAVVLEALKIAADHIQDVVPRVKATLERIDASLQAIKAGRETAQATARAHDLNYERLLAKLKNQSDLADRT